MSLLLVGAGVSDEASTRFAAGSVSLIAITRTQKTLFRSMFRFQLATNMYLRLGQIKFIVYFYSSIARPNSEEERGYSDSLDGAHVTLQVLLRR